MQSGKKIENEILDPIATELKLEKLNMPLCTQMIYGNLTWRPSWTAFCALPKKWVKNEYLNAQADPS